MIIIIIVTKRVFLLPQHPHLHADPQEWRKIQKRNPKNLLCILSIKILSKIARKMMIAKSPSPCTNNSKILCKPARTKKRKTICKYICAWKGWVWKSDNGPRSSASEWFTFKFWVLRVVEKKYSQLRSRTL